jgi:hypothetical protein
LERSEAVLLGRIRESLVKRGANLTSSTI